METMTESISKVKANAINLANLLGLEGERLDLLVQEMCAQSTRSFRAGNRSGIRWARSNGNLANA